MDFTLINSLRIREAFEDNQKFQIVVKDEDLLNDIFEWTDRGTVFIYDDAIAGHTVFVTDTNGLGADKTFRIDNRPHKDLFLWHIDGVLYKKNSKCDCAFLADKYLGLVEFKANAANNTNLAIADNYEKAVSQLELTFKDINDRCDKVGVDIRQSVTVEAYAVFNRTVPRSNAHQKKVSAAFFKKYDIPLFFRNSAEIV